jgi:hypothetical protein
MIKTWGNNKKKAYKQCQMIILKEKNKTNKHFKPC